MVVRSPKRQRGAIGLMAAVTLGLALLFMLLVVDSGRLYLEQRKLQRIADMAALEAAGQYATCTGNGPQATAIARVAATRNGHGVGDPLQANCGYLRTAANSLRVFTIDTARQEAIKVDVSHQVTTSIAGGVFNMVKEGNLPSTSTLHASAVAAKPLAPQAMLSLRSTLLTLDTRNSALLNKLLTPLGGQIQLDLIGWQGIANTNINLLKYLDQLAIEVGADVGNYQQVLDANATLTQMLQAAAKVLQQNGAAADVVTNLGNLATSVKGNKLGLHLRDILGIQSGTAQAGLDTNVQLLQMVQSMLLLAARDNAVTIDTTLDVLGLINGRVRIKVIEPQQFSAVGDPRTDELKVHTAQVRALISLNLPVMKTVSGLGSAIQKLTAPLTNLLKSLLGPLSGTDVIPAEDNDPHLDIGLELASATSQLRSPPPSGYSCAPKSLTTTNERAAVKIAVGRFDSADIFFSKGTNQVKTLPLIDVGTICLLCKREPYGGGGIGVRIDSKVLGNGSSEQEKTLVFIQPPDIGQPPSYLKIPNGNVVASLSETLMGIHLEAYNNNKGFLDELLSLTAGLLDGVKTILEPLIKGLVSPLIDPLIDPLVNALLKSLGIDLANAEVGANLTCSNGGAQLVQ
ncbi:pilus assembly protein TadG-related protein [Pseudomonas putida]